MLGGSKLGFNKFTLFTSISAILLLIPIFIFWGTITALVKDLIHQPCSKSDLNYRPLFSHPIFGPIPNDRIKYNRLKKCLPMTIFFKESANEEQITSLLNQLKVNKNIYLIDYISREKAIENYKETYKNQPIWLETMPEGNFLPASVAVYFNYEENKIQVTRDIKQNPLISEVITP